MQHGLDFFIANAGLDLEHDGLSNLLEYAVGGNPKITDAFERGMRCTIPATGANAQPRAFLRIADECL